MSKDLEKMNEVERQQENIKQQEDLENYRHKMDREAVERLAEKFKDRVPPERIAAMRELPTSFEEPETLENNYIRDGGKPHEPNEKVVGYSTGLDRPAHVATGDVEGLKTDYHERLHQMAEPGIQNELGRELTEGITEKFAEDTAGTLNLETGYECYPRGRAAVDKILAVCPQEVLEKAYFRGDTQELKLYLDNSFGPGELERLRQRLDDLPDLEQSRSQ